MIKNFMKGYHNMFVCCIIAYAYASVQYKVALHWCSSFLKRNRIQHTSFLIFIHVHTASISLIFQESSADNSTICCISLYGTWILTTATNCLVQSFFASRSIPFCLQRDNWEYRRDYAWHRLNTKMCRALRGYKTSNVC